MPTVLMCGATGLLGSAIAERLADQGVASRVLLRPPRAAQPFERRGSEIARGDFREPRSLAAACEGVSVVVTTVTAMGRSLAGERTTIRDVDEVGTGSLIAAAERAGVERFVYVSAAGVANRGYPLAVAKVRNEQRLRASRMREVIVSPVAFQEVWLSPVAGFDWPNGKMTIYGRGETKLPYVAVADVAEATIRLMFAEDPPRKVDFGGPEGLTRREAVSLFEDAGGRPLEQRRVPRLALRVGWRALAPVRPALSSIMGLALDMDLRDAPWDDAPLRALGIDGRPASSYIREVVSP